MSSSAIFGQIIEKLSDSEVTYDNRIAIYEVMLEVLEDFDVKNIEECLDIDRAFDEVWHEKYPELEDEDD